MEEKSFAPDVFNAECPARKTLNLVADKWTMLIILALLRGSRRHGELRRKVEGISQKMLTQTLRRLEADGLISRTVEPSRPPQVTYSLTTLGESLLEPVQALTKWAQEHSDEVEMRWQKK